MELETRFSLLIYCPHYIKQTVRRSQQWRSGVDCCLLNSLASILPLYSNRCLQIKTSSGMEGDQVVPDGPARLQQASSLEAALIREINDMKMEIKKLSGVVWRLTSAISLLIGTNSAGGSLNGERSVNANVVTISSERATVERPGNNNAAAYASRIILSNDE